MTIDDLDERKGGEEEGRRNTIAILPGAGTECNELETRVAEVMTTNDD